MSRTSDLVKAMVDIRDQDRLECGRHLFEKLGHPDSLFITEPQLDELLFKTVRKCLGTSIHADMLLMAFGLLPGYGYDCLSLGKRRMKFLRESNWLKVNRKSKIKDFDSASEDDLDSAAKSLPNVERYWMGKIADEFIKQIKQKDENDEEIKDPIENYIKLLDHYMAEVRDASGKIIDYVPKAPLADDSIPEEIDEEAGLPPEGNSATPPLKDDSTTTDGEQDSRSKKTAQPSTSGAPPSPPRFKIHIGSLSIGSRVNIDKVNINLSWVKYPALLILVVIVVVVVWVGLFRPQSSPESESLPVAETFPPVEETSPPVEEIFPSEREIVLVPGEKCPLKVAVLPVEAGNETLSFVSSDPNIVTVSRTGVLSACDNPETRGQPYEKVKITIQAESGVTETKTVVVNFAGVDPPKINKEIEAGFYIWHQIRLVGTKEWSTTVDAEIGDIVEIQIQYRNISEGDQRNVQIRDVLPTSLHYVAGTTQLWNDHLNGAVNNEDTIAATGINIGHYDPNANAYIRFRAEVVESGLAEGMNTLMNWAQAGVGDVTLQEATAVYVNKGE